MYCHIIHLKLQSWKDFYFKAMKCYTGCLILIINSIFFKPRFVISKVSYHAKFEIILKNLT